jgi:hypothetical protein
MRTHIIITIMLLILIFSEFPTCQSQTNVVNSIEVLSPVFQGLLNLVTQGSTNSIRYNCKLFFDQNFPSNCYNFVSKSIVTGPDFTPYKYLINVYNLTNNFCSNGVELCTDGMAHPIIVNDLDQLNLGYLTTINENSVYSILDSYVENLNDPCNCLISNHWRYVLVPVDFQCVFQNYYICNIQANNQSQPLINHSFTVFLLVWFSLTVCCCLIGLVIVCKDFLDS